MDENEKKCPDCPEGLPGWLQTFSDLMSLLLTFFVLLLSFANTDLIKYKEALGSIKDAFGVSVEEPGEFEGKSPNPLALEVPAPKTRVIKKEIVERKAEPTSAEQKEELKSLTQELQEAVKKAKMEEETEIEMLGDKVVIRAKGRIFFALGSSKIRKKSLPLLNEIGQIMKRFNYDLTVEGHTDNLKIKTRKYPSNWELSGSRASAVIRYFIAKNKILPIRLTAIGYAASRPIAPNKTKVGRAKNRRVEFVFSPSQRPDKYNHEESDYEQKEVF